MIYQEEICFCMLHVSASRLLSNLPNGCTFVCLIYNVNIVCRYLIWKEGESDCLH